MTNSEARALDSVAEVDERVEGAVEPGSSLTAPSPLSEGGKPTGRPPAGVGQSAAQPSSEKGDEPFSSTAIEQVWVSEVITPSRVEIRYGMEPKRKYEIRRQKPWVPGISSLKWNEVPSVTTVTDIIKDAGPLIWWGQGIGIKGVLELHRRGLVRVSKLSDGQVVMSTPGSVSGDSSELVVAGLEQIERLLKLEKLTVNHVKRSAGTRGQGAHDALELWAENGEMPDPEMWPPEERGYVQGLVMFLETIEEAGVEDVKSEVMVGSLEHGFAGRYDIEFKTTKPVQIVKRWLPKKGPQYATLEPGLYVPDLKTSKGVYDSHVLQVEGYEIGRIECGYGASVARGVIHVHPGDPNDPKLPDGPHYEFVKSWAQPEDFLDVLQVYRSQQAMKERK